MPALKYEPTTRPPIQFSGGARPAIVVGTVTDRRGVDERIVMEIGGTDTYQLSRPVAAEVRDALIAELRRIGIAPVGSVAEARGVLEADVTHLSVHPSRVSMRTRLRRSEGTPPLWEESLDGSSTSRGPTAGGGVSGRVVVEGVPMGGAYQKLGEAMWAELSAALSDAVGNLGRLPGFVEAVAKLAPGSQTVATERRAPAGSVSPPRPSPRDVDPPKIAINHPADQARTNEENILLAGIVTDNEAVARVEILVNGEPLPSFRSIQVTAATPGRSVPINIPVPLRPGTNVIVLNAHDREGNVSQAVRTIVREASAGVGAELATRNIPSQNLINRYVQELERAGKGRAIFTASEAGELSQESQRWGGGHGAFTHFLLEAMKGAGDTNGDGVVTLGEAMDYVSEHVRRETRNAQHPATAGRFDRNIPLAVHR